MKKKNNKDNNVSIGHGVQLERPNSRARTIQRRVSPISNILLAFDSTFQEREAFITATIVSRRLTHGLACQRANVDRHATRESLVYAVTSRVILSPNANDFVQRNRK